MHPTLVALSFRSVPCQTICDNAGLEGAVVVGKLLDHAKGKTNSSYGMNAATGEYLVWKSHSSRDLISRVCSSTPGL